MPLPIAPRVGVPVERQDEGTHGVLHVPPGLGPLMIRQAHPGGIAAELGLSVGLSGIGLLNLVALEETNEVGTPRRLHRGGIARQLLEDRVVVVGVPHLVAHEHHSALVLPVRVPKGELGVLPDAYLEDPSDMSLLS